MGPKREREKRKMLIHDVWTFCVERQHEGSQPRQGRLGKRRTKAYAGPTHHHSWMNRTTVFGSGTLRISYSRHRRSQVGWAVCTAIMHVERHEGWGLRIALQGSIARKRIWKV